MLLTKLRSALLSAVILISVSCKAQEIKELTPKQFQSTLYKDPNSLILDVRTAEEYETLTHLQRAYLIDYNRNDFQIRVDQLERSKNLYVYCRSGKRSAEAAAKLKKMGFKTIYTMKGGIESWEAEGLPTERSKGAK